MREWRTKSDWYSNLDELADRPMAVLSLAIVPLFVIPVAFDISNGLERAFDIAAWAIWGVFLVELVVMLFLAEDALDHLKKRWYELPAVVAPLLIVVANLSIGLLGFLVRPMRLLRSARVVRSSRMLRALRGSRFVAFLGRFTTSAGEFFGKHGLRYALAVGAILYFLAAGLILLFERNEGNITTYGDALWWGMTAMTPLPNDTLFPVTVEGKIVAVLVALLGLTLAGIVTANIAAHLMAEDQLTSQEFQAKMTELEQSLADLRQSLEAREGVPRSGSVER